MDSKQRNRTSAYARRTLNKTIPELEQYLKRGMQVLDVGCGPGSITLDVADRVRPGIVWGVDSDPDRIEAAKLLAKERQIHNVRFMLGDARKLEVEGDSFDLIYSHTVMQNLFDPIRALQEQKRAARPKAPVMAFGVRDYGLIPRHPPTPLLDRLTADWSRYAEATSARELNPNKSSFFDPFAGRKCSGWFTKAGLSVLKVEIKIHEVHCAGKIPDVNDPRGMVAAAEQVLSTMYQDAVAEGYIEEGLLAEAKNEIAEWRVLPDAFHAVASVTVAAEA